MPASREILAANLKDLMAVNGIDGQSALAKWSKAEERPLSQSMVSRMLNAQGDIDIGTLDKLAALFNVDSWRLLAPHMGGPKLQDLTIGGRRPPPPAEAAKTAHIAPAPRVKTPK